MYLFGSSGWYFRFFSLILGVLASHIICCRSNRFESQDGANYLPQLVVIWLKKKKKTARMNTTRLYVAMGNIHSSEISILQNVKTIAKSTTQLHDQTGCTNNRVNYL